MNIYSQFITRYIRECVRVYTLKWIIDEGPIPVGEREMHECVRVYTLKWIIDEGPIPVGQREMHECKIVYTLWGG